VNKCNFDNIKMHGTDMKILKKHLDEVRVSKGERSADYFVRGPVQHSFAC